MSATAGWRDVVEGRARWAVVHGDCLEVMAEMPDGCVDVTLQDPPYEAEAHTSQRRLMTGTQRSGGGGWKPGHLTVGAAIDEFEPISESTREQNGAHVSRLTRRWALTFCQVEARHKWEASLTVAALHRYIRTCVYVKLDPQPQLTGDRPGMGWETIVATHGTERTRWNGGGRCGVFYSLSGKSVDRRDGRGVHPTQKPTELMLELVDLFTDPDELVLDPFAGSGTTGVACLRLGRRCVLVEKDAKFAALARERMVAAEQGLTLRDSRAGQLPLLWTP